MKTRTAWFPFRPWHRANSGPFEMLFRKYLDGINHRFADDALAAKCTTRVRRIFASIALRAMIGQISFDKRRSLIERLAVSLREIVEDCDFMLLVEKHFQCRCCRCNRLPPTTTRTFMAPKCSVAQSKDQSTPNALSDGCFCWLGNRRGAHTRDGRAERAPSRLFSRELPFQDVVDVDVAHAPLFHLRAGSVYISRSCSRTNQSRPVIIDDVFVSRADNAKPCSERKARPIGGSATHLFRARATPTAFFLPPLSPVEYAVVRTFLMR